ncbi:outer membrane receptor for ferric coprogen and ferric-rhodotorulic acid [Paracidovorax anthurii]|uniref:Outer membrane receptor for ferric coprogen and ferric-rhodotorulic acid n=2 Tax=Paracidovorax anthurii TaxID=78229 RepID=A0A328ZSS1_9BURK|nr:TonB-dependent receptor [Paracidovorax anthurii]RAR85326.1 outer membrane receptor for ferric coprogen and ferric-rhodotorulic acid [Paracidovorax anthurii]
MPPARRHRTTPAPRPLARAGRAALLCAAALGGLLPGAPAAQAPSQTAAERMFSIPAGPLAQVVARYAHAAGVALSFHAAPLAGRHSPGLQGRWGVEAGFARLLEGSGLQAARGAGGIYTLRALAPARGAAATLSTVTVSAPAAGAAVTTEHSASYAGGAVTLFPGAASARGIPQPVTVVTRRLMDDRALRDLHDVLQQTPGIAVDYTDSERVTYWSRGHQIDTLQVDGLPLGQNAPASLFIQPDTAVLDRVEILRGAAGLLRGAGSPSATVNLARKRPTPDFQASAALSLGSWNRRRLEADLSGPLGATSALRGRLVAVADDKDFFQAARSESRRVLYGAIEADLAPGTTLAASLQHTALDATGAWGGLPAHTDGTPLNLPRGTYLGTDWNQWDRHNQQAFAELSHRWGNGWSARLGAAHTRLRTDGFRQTSFSSASATNPYLVNVSTSLYGADAGTQNALGLAASGPVQLFGRRHALTVGADALRMRTTGPSGHWGVGPLNGIDLRDWDPYRSYPEPAYAPGNGTAFTADASLTRQQGAHATARLSLADPLTATLGARVGWWRHEVPANPAGSYGVDREVTPYAGLVYDLSDRVSAYASYSEIFTPQNYRAASGGVIAPLRGEDFEAGLKGEFLGGRLSASLSVFRIHHVGQAELDTAAASSSCVPASATSACYRAGGKSRSEGWELEVAGEPGPGWQVMAGYTYTRTRQLRDAVDATAGQPLRSVDPRHALRLFASHRLGGGLRGWTVGGGARVQSDAYATVGSVTARQGGYALFDALLAYRIDRTYTVQLNVNNLSDKTYYSKFSPNSTYFNNYYGDPRNVTLSLRADF